MVGLLIWQYQLYCFRTEINMRLVTACDHRQL
jgi:hypothetical protein